MASAAWLSLLSRFFCERIFLPDDFTALEEEEALPGFVPPIALADEHSEAVEEVAVVACSSSGDYPSPQPLSGNNTSEAVPQRATG
eukprot:scaffold335_cov192-Ochromonas_danica.AAC.2